MTTAGSRYTSHRSNTPTPCGGRTGDPCTTQSLHGSGAPAADGSRYTMTTSASAAGMLFSVGLISLVVLGARRLRHPHGHHAATGPLPGEGMGTGLVNGAEGKK
jgi:hypothetical protein